MHSLDIGNTNRCIINVLNKKFLLAAINQLSQLWIMDLTDKVYTCANKLYICAKEIKFTWKFPAHWKMITNIAFVDQWQNHFLSNSNFSKNNESCKTAIFIRHVLQHINCSQKTKGYSKTCKRCLFEDSPYDIVWIQIIFKLAVKNIELWMKIV